MTSELGEKPEARSTSLYVTDWKVYEECKTLLRLQGRSLSEEIMSFVIRRRDELKGNGSSTQDSGRMFEQLKGEHFTLGQKVDKFKTVLQEKKVYDDCLKRFGEILGYDASESSWIMNECVMAIDNFLKHSNNGDWKRAETRFLVSYKGGGIMHTFLDYLECCRERKGIDRKLLELRVDPEELARLDELERQEEEQKKKDVEKRKTLEAEEARKQKEEEEKEDPYPDDYSEEEEEEDEGEGFTVEPHLAPFVPEIDREKSDSKEDPEEEGGEHT